jgi:hypothetical protein
VLVKKVYGALGSGANLVVRRAWVLVCVLLFVTWISIDICAGAQAAALASQHNASTQEQTSQQRTALQKHNRLQGVLPDKWPVDAILASLLEPYSFKTQSVQQSGVNDTEPSFLCTCTYSGTGSQQAVEAPYLKLQLSDEPSNYYTTPWGIISQCDTFNNSGNFTAYKKFNRYTGPYDAFDALLTELMNTKIYTRISSVQMDRLPWKIARFREYRSECK